MFVIKIRKAIIPAAGLGTRFLPATKAQPKEMLPLVDKPTIQYIVEEAVNSGIEDIMLITGRGKRAIEDHFDKSYELEQVLENKGDYDMLRIVRGISNLVDIHYVRQKEPLGLGHAVYCARTFAGNEPFAVLLGDDIILSDKPCLKQMIEVYNSLGKTILGVQCVPREDVSKYGILECTKVESRLYKVNSMVEKPDRNKAPSNVAIMGRYIITPEIFQILENTTPGKGGEIQLTDALKKLSEIETMYAYEFEGERFDVGNKLGYLQATIRIALQNDELKNDLMEYMRNKVANS